MSSHQPSSSLCFAEFEIDAKSRRLLRDGKLITLNAKTFDLLAFLTANAGRIISKDEILNAVWENQFVEEANLPVQISALRKVLGEPKDVPRFLVTVPGKGYKFVAEVQTTDKMLIDGNHQSSQFVGNRDNKTETNLKKNGLEETSTPQKPSSRIVLISLGFLCLFSLAAIGLWRVDRKPEETHGLKITRLLSGLNITAVTLSPDGKYAVFAEREADGEGLWLKQIATGSQTRIVAPQHLRYIGLTVSPDNNFVYASMFLENKADTPLWRIPLLGGAAKEIAGIITGISISFSPDGKQFAYTLSDDANNATYVKIADADGSNNRILIRAENSQRNFIIWNSNSLAWSPDGKDIAIALEEKNAAGGKHSGILLADAVNGSERFLLTPSYAEIRDLAWTDTENLAFVGYENDKRGNQLWTVSRQDGTVRQLTDNLPKYKFLSSANGNLLSAQHNTAGHLFIADFNEKSKMIVPREILSEGTITCVAWTADNKILYVSKQSGTNEIWRVNANGDQAVQLTSDANITYGFTVSHIDDSIVFSSARSGDSKNSLWLVNADGKNLRRLTDDANDTFPDFTADGKAVVFQRGLGNEALSIWSISIKDKSIKQLAVNSSMRPAVSPDGSQIAFYTMASSDGGRDSGWAISLMSSVDGTKLKQLSEPKENLGERFLRWYPSGEFLSQIESDGKSSNLFLIPTNGGKAQIFPGFGKERIEWFAWSPDGKQIVISQETETQDLVLMNNY